MYPEVAVVERNRPAWQGSTRRDRLPADWPQKRARALKLNPKRVCHWCGLEGGTTLDHKIRGDDHSQENLDWIHDRQDVTAGRSRRNCHGEKTGAEGAAARVRLHRPAEQHPAFK